MNLGANSVTDCGLYFQWAGTQGYTGSQILQYDRQYLIDYAPYYDAEHDDYNKYNAYELNTIESLSLVDDAAHTLWGGGWKIPRSIEFQTLINATNRSWETNYNNSGVNGLLCISKTDSNNVLFFPAGGYYEDDLEYNALLVACWTSDLYHDCYEHRQALCVLFDDNAEPYDLAGYDYASPCVSISERYCALNIRPILADTE